MSGKPAARVGDDHSCPMTQPNGSPHVGGPILAGATKTEIGDALATRLEDKASCIGAIDTIAQGAMPVPIEGKAAARQTDPTEHGGAIVEGEPTVLIGLAGTVGNVFVGKKLCEAAPDGRSGDRANQSYNNCGVESSRMIVNQVADTPVTEDALLQSAIDNAWASDKNGDGLIQFEDGGTLPENQAALLQNNGIGASTMNVNALDLQTALANGQGAIVQLDAAVIWGGGQPAESWHAVQLTGITYDDNGEIVSYTINDSGTGECAKEYDKKTFEDALKAYRWNETHDSAVITDEPIW